ncbi:MAG: exonuclease [Christensenellaceae bacterium]|nr:exonuclease [Christensenellaceae bacterium]
MSGLYFSINASGELVRVDAPEKQKPSREGKGRSLLEALSSYVVLDLETTGLDPRWDSIIEIAAVRVQDGKITDQFQTLVNPGFEVDNFIIELTGITNEMLSSAPSVEDVLPRFVEFVGDSVVIGHNVNFDVNFIYDDCKRIMSVPFANDFIDTMRVSRRLYKEYSNHTLSDLLERFSIGGNVEHRALSDVLKTNACYVYMKDYASSHDIEFASLYPLKGGVSAKNIQTGETEFDESTAVYNKLFVFTGALERMTRKEAMQIVVDMGGKVADNVTKKTSYLVLGNNDYCTTIKDGKSTKQKKAEQFKLSGLDIETISEDIFYEMLSGQ